MTAAEFRFWTLFALFWLGVAGVYALSCWLWPYKKHARCDGSGKHYNKSGTAFKLCQDEWWGLVKGCKGSGRVLRFGRRAYNYLNKNKVDAR